jgi:hypothetical protein
LLVKVKKKGLDGEGERRVGEKIVLCGVSLGFPSKDEFSIKSMVERIFR